MSIRIHELGHIVLYVSDISRMADFYKHTLGFHEIARKNNFALFSSGRTHHELLLIGIGEEPRQKERIETGLYHIGFKIGNSDDELREAIESLRQSGVTIVGTADHAVTHSLYILDPDGNELELYVDITDAWKSDAELILSPTKPLHL